jgi:uncharacterized protein (DUF362 family)
MSKKISRRVFIKQSAAISVSASLFPGAILAEAEPNVAVVEGDDYFKNTIEAVTILGGMTSFVSKSSKIAILANPQRNNPGAFTNPAVLRAVIRMCKSAGADRISCISWLPEKNWQNTGLKSIVEQEKAELRITDLKDENLFEPVPVPEGKELKEARIMKTLFEYDGFINVPITKDHAGNKFTGTLKNLMGLNSPANNRTFHKKDWKTNPESIAYLDQCIADLNTVIKPLLCVVDASEFIITNGPFGPGELYKPKKVVAGVDRVAVDAYCSTLWGLKPNDIFMINKAHKHGIGEIDLKKLRIKEIKV